MRKDKYFILTVDTEPDNEWGRSTEGEMAMRNAEEIPRFQDLCRKFGLRPVYLIDYQMSQNEKVKECLTGFFKNGECEIGAHLHPWSTPPFDFKVTEDDYRSHPFCTQYPIDVFLAKMNSLTKSIQSNFGVSPISFRAGRYVITRDYLIAIREFGFRVDCSVTPSRKWSHDITVQGADFTDFTSSPFFWDAERELLEVPISSLAIERKRSMFNPYKIASNYNVRLGLDKVLGTLRFPLKGGDLFFHYKKYDSVEFFIRNYSNNPKKNLLHGMLHSSELILGGCFKKRHHFNNYWNALRRSFELITDMGYRPKTLSEYYEDYMLHGEQLKDAP